MDDFRARKASELLGSILTPQTAASVQGWSDFFGSWGKVAGPSIAAHSRPVDVRNGIVFVEAEHPGWIQLLQMNQHRILERLRSGFPELGISGIAFRLARDGSLPGTAVPARTGTELGAGTEVRTPGATGTEVAVGTELVLGTEVPSGAPRLARGQSPDGPAPTVEQTLEHIEDDGFRSIMASLAQTLGSSDENRAPGTEVPDGKRKNA